jgi:hypothetical protein
MAAIMIIFAVPGTADSGVQKEADIGQSCLAQPSNSLYDTIVPN